MTLEEAILDKLRHLPRAQQEEVLRFADGLQRQDTTNGVAANRRAVEMKWICENRTGYADQWVALEGNRLIAADKDALKVFATAKAEGIKSPFVMHVPPDDSLPFAPGW
jgi:hypothetical protein